MVVATIAKIRRLHLGQGLPIKAICPQLGLSRKVVRKVLRSGATEFRYERAEQPHQQGQCTWQRQPAQPSTPQASGHHDSGSPAPRQGIGQHPPGESPKRTTARGFATVTLKFYKLLNLRY